MTVLKTRKAEIVQVVGPRNYEDALGYRHVAAGHVVARDENGATHMFITGSMNGLRSEWRTVGLKGTVSFIKCGSYSLWFFDQSTS
jgi:hypothetical protein